MSSQKKPVFLIISQVYPPDPAAVGQYMHDAAKAMAERGAEVRVLTSARGYDDPSLKYPPREEMEGVQIIRLPLSSLGKKTIVHRLVAQSLFLLQAIVRGLFTRRLCCILISTSPPMASVAASIIRLFRRTAVKFWVMDLNPDQLIEMGKITEKSFPARVFNLLNRWILRVSDDVIPLDRFMADRLNKKRDVREKMSILPPWPLSDHLEPVRHAENPFRQQHGLAGKFVVMYSGNHGQTTPVKTVLDAAVQMQDREDLVFMFIGGGAGKQDVEATIAEHHPTNIIDLPYQPLERVRYSLSAADVHVVTMGDNVVGVIHPCKVYGAMALGRPLLLVGPPECHVSDIMENQSIGWHVQHGDVDALITAVDEMRQLPQAKLHEMGQKAMQIVQTRFQRQQMIDEFPGHHVPLHTFGRSAAMTSGFRVDHVGVAVKDIDESLTQYTELFGYRLVRGPFDDPQQQARVAFICTDDPGDTVLELVAPLDEQSQVQRVLAKGLSLYHVCYEVPDIEQAISHLRQQRCLLVSGPTPAVAYDGRPIAWLYTPNRQLTELVEAPRESS